jgi:hypothetical protein
MIEMKDSAVNTVVNIKGSLICLLSVSVTFNGLAAEVAVSLPTTVVLPLK